MNGAESLVLLCWNLHGLPWSWHWGRRCNSVARWVRATRPQPDLLLFSEVWLRAHWSVLREALRPEFHPVSTIGDFGLGPRGGLAAFFRRASAWTIEEESFEPLRSSAPWWRVWEGDGLARKGIHTLVLRGTSRRVVVLHTHFQAQYGRRTYARVRAAQWAQLADCARARARGATAVCAAGDFNTTPHEHLLVHQLEHWIDLTESLRNSGASKGTTVHEPHEWIDYVLLWRSAAEAVKATDVQLAYGITTDGHVSDHHGLLAQFFFS